MIYCKCCQCVRCCACPTLIPGPQGPPGAAGPPGQRGESGPTGPAGKNATITIQNTITGAPGTNAQVQNLGRDGDAELVFVIPSGATGPAGSSRLGGMQAQLSRSVNGLLANKENVIFDAIISQTSSDISYNSVSGEFSLPANKNYSVSWWVSVDGTELTPVIEFSVAINGYPIAVVSSPQVTCHLSGTALISVGDGADLLTLINVSGNTVRYADTSTQAGITIIELM